MKVRVVGRKGHAVLVEWRDEEGYQRAYVPAKVVEDDYCPDDELLLGIPHGLPWGEIVGDLVISGEEIEQALRAHGIWTLEDAQENATRAAAALLAVHKGGVETLVRRAMGAMSKEPEGAARGGR